jgi:hypothetical protein
LISAVFPCKRAMCCPERQHERIIQQIAKLR